MPVKRDEEVVGVLTILSDDDHVQWIALLACTLPAEPQASSSPRCAQENAGVLQEEPTDRKRVLGRLSGFNEPALTLNTGRNMRLLRPFAKSKGCAAMMQVLTAGASHT